MLRTCLAQGCLGARGNVPALRPVAWCATRSGEGEGGEQEGLARELAGGGEGERREDKVKHGYSPRVKMALQMLQESRWRTGNAATTARKRPNVAISGIDKARKPKAATTRSDIDAKSIISSPMVVDR